MFCFIYSMNAAGLCDAKTCLFSWPTSPPLHHPPRPLLPPLWTASSMEMHTALYPCSNLATSCPSCARGLSAPSSPAFTAHVPFTITSRNFSSGSSHPPGSASYLSLEDQVPMCAALGSGLVSMLTRCHTCANISSNCNCINCSQQSTAGAVEQEPPPKRLRTVAFRPPLSQLCHVGSFLTSSDPREVCHQLLQQKITIQSTFKAGARQVPLQNTMSMTGLQECLSNPWQQVPESPKVPSWGPGRQLHGPSGPPCMGVMGDLGASVAGCGVSAQELQELPGAFLSSAASLQHDVLWLLQAAHASGGTISAPVQQVAWPLQQPSAIMQRQMRPCLTALAHANDELNAMLAGAGTPLPSWQAPLQLQPSLPCLLPTAPQHQPQHQDHYHYQHPQQERQQQLYAPVHTSSHCLVPVSAYSVLGDCESALVDTVSDTALCMPALLPQQPLMAPAAVHGSSWSAGGSASSPGNGLRLDCKRARDNVGLHLPISSHGNAPPVALGAPIHSSMYLQACEQLLTSCSSSMHGILQKLPSSFLNAMPSSAPSDTLPMSRRTFPRCSTGTLDSGCNATCRVFVPVCNSQGASPLPCMPMPLTNAFSGQSPEDVIRMSHRTLGCTNQSTLELAIHIWSRVSVRSVRCAQASALGWITTAACNVSIYALTCMWLCVKLEEQRRSVPGAGALGRMLGAPPAMLNQLELVILAWLDWAPYRGFEPSEPVDTLRFL